MSFESVRAVAKVGESAKNYAVDNTTKDIDNELAMKSADKAGKRKAAMLNEKDHINSLLMGPTYSVKTTDEMLRSM